MDFTKQSLEADLRRLTINKKEELKNSLEKIIEILPEEYSSLINEAFKFKRIPKEYLLSSILFAISSSIGLTFYIKALGYKNYANCYFAIIGSRGDTKSEAKNIATTPLVDRDNIDYDSFLNEKKHLTDDEAQIKRKQILIQNATIEAAYEVHLNNPNSIGIFMDEVHTLIEKMTNSNSRDGGAWRSFFLEGYTNGAIDIARKTTDSFRIKKTYPTLIGGLQKDFIPFLFSKGNLESGFIDRLLFTSKITANHNLIRGEIDPQILINYSQLINNILSYKRQSELEEETKKQFQVLLTSEAESRIFKYTQELINRQIKAPPVIKEYMSKMQISIQKLSLLVFMMRNALQKSFANNLSLQDVELAIALNEFYLLNFKIILESNKEKKETLPSTESVIRLAKRNSASQKAVAEVTGSHKGTISKKWKLVNEQLAT
ncbi:MAG: DUF3987 domain-containing protein [Patiriisocius sp.]|uniref:DUF3987 domain-containing protein n=1 Tax=Patiriisocius sp. TaxID=2822396 RepID=UPI003EFAE2FC